MSQKILDIVEPGVVWGEDLLKVYEAAKASGFSYNFV